jgi:hypothetical protein
MLTSSKSPRPTYAPCKGTTKYYSKKFITTGHSLFNSTTTAALDAAYGAAGAAILGANDFAMSIAVCSSVIFSGLLCGTIICATTYYCIFPDSITESL